MWPYKNITREEFEARKDYVESLLIHKGAMPSNYTTPHNSSSYGNGFTDNITYTRTTYEYNSEYYRVDEVLFPEKPFIVIEWAEKIEDVLKNCMEDTDPFPFDLSDETIAKEIEHIMNSNTEY